MVLSPKHILWCYPQLLTFLWQDSFYFHFIDEKMEGNRCYLLKTSDYESNEVMNQMSSSFIASVLRYCMVLAWCVLTSVDSEWLCSNFVTV